MQNVSVMEITNFIISINVFNYNWAFSSTCIYISCFWIPRKIWCIFFIMAFHFWWCFQSCFLDFDDFQSKRQMSNYLSYHLHWYCIFINDWIIHPFLSWKIFNVWYLLRWFMTSNICSFICISVHCLQVSTE